MIKSRFELRLEAARLVLQLPETTIDNFHERAYRMELYLLGDVELPETYTETTELKQSMDDMLDSVLGALSKEHDKGADNYARSMALAGCRTPMYECTSAFEPTAPGGKPSAEGEMMGFFMGGHGGKVE